MAPGGPRWQETGQCCELSCCLGGHGRSCPPGGQKHEPPRGHREWPWAGLGGAIPSKALADTLRHRRMEPARLEANRPAGHEQAPAVRYSSGKPGCCRLRLAERQMVVYMHTLPPKQEWMRPWNPRLKAGIRRYTRFQSPQGNNTPWPLPCLL